MVTQKPDCNIGPAGIRRRRRMAYIFTVISIFHALLIWYLEVEPAWRLLIFIPVFLTALYYLQAWLQFCVVFGAAGRNKLFDNEPVAMQPEFHKRKSQWRALRITLSAIVIAAFVTAIIYYFPLD